MPEYTVKMLKTKYCYLKLKVSERKNLLNIVVTLQKI